MLHKQGQGGASLGGCHTGCPPHDKCRGAQAVAASCRNTAAAARQQAEQAVQTGIRHTSQGSTAYACAAVQSAARWQAAGLAALLAAICAATHNKRPALMMNSRAASVPAPRLLLLTML
jgi:hypothetical protein